MLENIALSGLYCPEWQGEAIGAMAEAADVMEAAPTTEPVVVEEETREESELIEFFLDPIAVPIIWCQAE
jgi:hypothetical protein